MASLPNYQESPVNGNKLAGKPNTGELFPKTNHGFWGEIFDKPVDNPVDTTLSDSESVAELDGSRGHVQPLTPVRVSDVMPLALAKRFQRNQRGEAQVQEEVLASAGGSTNTAQQLDLFQVSLELLQERLALS